MIEYEKTEKMVKYNEQNYKELKKIVEEYKEKKLEEIDLELLIEKLNNFIETIQVYDDKIKTIRRESEEDSRKYFGEDFINQFEHIKKIVNQSNCQLLIHGTRTDLLDSIVQNGLYLSGNLDSTTYSCTSDDNYIYSKLLNWEHHYSKGLVLISIPNECLSVNNRKPLININKQGNRFLKSEFIIGVIDVTKKEIHLNPLYNRNHDYSKIDIIANEVINNMFITEEEKENKKILNSNIHDSNIEKTEYYNELQELFKEFEENKSDDEIYSECIQSLNNFFFGLGHELSNFFYGDDITLEDWNNKEMHSILEKLNEIKNIKYHKHK